MNNISEANDQQRRTDIHINMLDLETLWKAFRSLRMSRKLPFQMDNTPAAAYLLKEGGTDCKTSNGLASRILLKCLKNGIVACSEYLRVVINLRANALSRGKEVQKWSLGDPIGVECSGSGNPNEKESGRGALKEWSKDQGMPFHSWISFNQSWKDYKWGGNLIMMIS